MAEKSIDIEVYVPVAKTMPKKIIKDRCDFWFVKENNAVVQPYWQDDNGNKLQGMFEAGTTYTVVIPGTVNAAVFYTTAFTINGYPVLPEVRPDGTIILKMDFTTEPEGVTVSGTVITYGDVSEITVTLTADDPASTFKPQVWTGNGGKDVPAAYTFTNVPEGTYTITVEKKDHVTREYTIHVQ